MIKLESKDEIIFFTNCDFAALFLGVATDTVLRYLNTCLEIKGFSAAFMPHIPDYAEVSDRWTLKELNMIKTLIRKSV